MRKLRKPLIALILLLLLFSFAGAAWAQEEPPKEDKGGMFERILAGIVAVPCSVIEGLFKWGGFEKLDKLVFLKGYSEEEKKSLPWKGDEPKHVRLWFQTLAYVTAPFFAIVIAVNAYKLLYAAANPAARSEAMESLHRCVLAVFIVALAPLMVSTVMWMCTILVDAVAGAFNHVAAALGMPRAVGDWSAVEIGGAQIVTGSVLGTAIVRLFLAGMFAYLNVLYIMRKVALTVFFAFTPLAAMIWAVRKESTAMPVWIGELLSNAFMPVAHALVLCTILLLCDVKDMGRGTWVTILISFYTLIPLAEVLRNSLQSIIAHFAGFNEAATASKIFGAAMGLGGVFSLVRAGGSLFGGGGKTPPFAGATTTVPPGGEGGRPIGFRVPQPASPPPLGGPTAPGGAAPQIGGTAPPLYAGTPGTVPAASPGASPAGAGMTVPMPHRQGGLVGRAKSFAASPRATAALKVGAAAGKAAALGVGALAALTLPAVPGGQSLVKPVAAVARGVYGVAAGGAYLAGDYAARYAGKKLSQAAQSGSRLAQKTVQAGKAAQGVGQRAADWLLGPQQGRQAPAPVAQAPRQIGFRPPVQSQQRARYPASAYGLDGIRER
ncbi:MAG: hypothetical protein HPY58_13180 [Firmicutes bacterium]|nr:hypothetical protein [Bacillota bacterium]